MLGYNETWQNINLDKHNVECEQDEVITQFRLNRRSSTQDKLRYMYRCCKMSA